MIKTKERRVEFLDPRINHTPKRKAKKFTSAQKLALVIGGVACFVLSLSIYHCTEALMVLTGSPWILGFLLAVGIDFGMVACEVVTVAGNIKSKAWAERYIALAVLLSMGLNSFASGQQATTMPVLAYVVGALVPCLVFILAKVAAHQWKGK